MIHVSKVFLTKNSRYFLLRRRTIWDTRGWKCFCWENVTNVEGTHLEEEIIGNPNVKLSLTFCRNEKVKHHLRMQTHKYIVLRFCVE